jgi:TPR repeat protein
MMYSNGIGVAQDYHKAAELFTLAANQGDASALNNLGMIYSNGIGVAQDFNKAAELYTLTAN